jgi:methyl-accepting chemotaxis protein/methyl-accepting chemotaxis protein-1 (serine sensor receptor)
MNKTAKTMELAGAIATQAFEMRSAQRGVVVFSVLKEPAKVEQNKQMFQAARNGIEKAVADIRPLLIKPASRQALDMIQTELISWPLLYQEILQQCGNQNFGPDLSRVMDKTGAINKVVSEATTQLLQVQKETQAESAQSAAGTISSNRWIAFVLIGVCLLVGAGVVIIVRQISSALGQLAAEMADGADQVSAAASQVSSSSQSLAQGSSEQAASIQQTSASSEEIHSMTRKNAENSRVAADSMVEASIRIGEANRNLEQMVVSMNEINASSDKISKIIKVIDEIAFQTNILALNAAVEAARAGEAGMGFAVVADEVRNLAQRCAQAAKDTAGLIEESITKSNDGKTKLDQVAVAVRSITDSAAKVKTLVDEVKLGSEEQARGIEQVSKAIAQMEKVTQTTAANAEESASASQELSAQSDTLRTIVARLNSMVGGGAKSLELPVQERKRAASRPPVVGARLHTATAQRRYAPDRASETALAAVHADKGAFPLDEDFKEF